MSFKSLTNERASALLIALLLMGFLAVFGVGMSRLIVGAIRVERNVVESGKSYFAAESAIERGLYAHRNRLVGYEVQKDPAAEATFTLKNGATVTADTVGVSTDVPCKYREEWRSLELQNSVSWPLFRWDAEKGRVDLGAFDLKFKFDRITSVKEPVLRWKILGLTSDGNTEAISGLMEYSSNSALNVLNQASSANFYSSNGGGTYTNYPSYTIRDFLEKHQFNYLTLINVTNLDVQPSDAQTAQANVLRLQLHAEEGAACEYTLIRGVGESGGTSQSIDAQVKLDSFLPVFNFVLYQVGESESE